MRKIMGWGLAAWSCLVLGCSSGAESGPVTLPVPFAGDLTLAKHVIANGLPTSECNLRGHPSGNEWDIIDDNGELIGRFFFDCASADNFTFDGRQDGYTIDVVIELNDGSMLRVANMQFFEVPYPLPLDPGFDLAQAIEPGESGASIVAKQGIASGIIVAGTGRFAGTVGQTLDHRYLFNEVVHEDGTFTFFGINVGSTLIHFENEGDIFFEIGSGVVVQDVLAVMFENDTQDDFVPNEKGTFVMPLFCEGNVDVPCATVYFPGGEMTILDEATFETKYSFVTYCTRSSCATFPNVRSIDSVITGVEVPDFPEGTVLSSTIADHEPTTCAGCTGEFTDDCCAGRLSLNFRCMTVVDVDPMTGEITRLRTFGGPNIISRKK